MTLKNETTGIVIPDYCWISSKQDVSQVESKALDGTVYLQIIGSPSVTITADIILEAEMKPTLEAAHASGALMSVGAGSAKQYGRITGLSFKNKIRGGLQRCTVTLAKEEE